MQSVDELNNAKYALRRWWCVTMVCRHSSAAA